MKHSFVPRALLVMGLVNVASFAAHAQAPAPAGQFFFRDGDRAQITGDSITQGKTYSTLVESYVLSRFPTWKITFRNTGWSGDTMGLRTRGGLDKGFTRDIEPLQSTAVTIDFGMNDARGGQNGLDNYLASARNLTDKLTATGARVALVTSSPEEKYEADQPAGSTYNAMLRAYSAGLKGVAAEKNVLFVDQLNPIITTIEAGRKAGVLSATLGGPRLVPDGVHPNWAGGLVMATHILKGLNAPQLVSKVELDAKTGVPVAENAKVSQVKTGATLSFTRLDNALPWPIGKVEPALQIPGFAPLDDLSRYELKVTNLTAPNSDLLIDGAKVATFTAAQLAAGVNLSSLDSGPIAEQKNALLKAISDKNDLFYTRWRMVQLYEFPTWAKVDIEASRAAEVKRLDDQIAAAQTQIDALRLPKPHVWTLQPAA